jgi:hypothetical protein
LEARRGMSFRECRIAETRAAAERDRVAAITALGQSGEEKLIAACIADLNCTPALAALKLRRAGDDPRMIARRMLAAHRKAGGSRG